MSELTELEELSFRAFSKQWERKHQLQVLMGYSILIFYLAWMGFWIWFYLRPGGEMGLKIALMLVAPPVILPLWFTPLIWSNVRKMTSDLVIYNEEYWHITKLSDTSYKIVSKAQYTELCLDEIRHARVARFAYSEEETAFEPCLILQTTAGAKLRIPLKVEGVKQLEFEIENMGRLIQ